MRLRCASGARPDAMSVTVLGVPASIRLAASGPSVLALGGHFKNAVCITRGNQAFLSPQAGDLDDPANRRALNDTVEQLLHALQIKPAMVAHDLHPDYYSSSFAAAFAEWHGLP